MELWIARDKDGELYLYNKKPSRQEENFCIFHIDGGDCCKIPDEYYPSVTWENSPKKMTIELAEPKRELKNTAISTEESVQLNAPANPILSRGLHEFGLSVRAMHCLQIAGIHTVGDLVQWKRSDLIKLRNFGLHTIREIDDFLTDNNLTFGMKV